jgi:hypothetical protein
MAEPPYRWLILVRRPPALERPSARADDFATSDSTTPIGRLLRSPPLIALVLDNYASEH